MKTGLFSPGKNQETKSLQKSSNYLKTHIVLHQKLAISPKIDKYFVYFNTINTFNAWYRNTLTKRDAGVECKTEKNV